MGDWLTEIHYMIASQTFVRFPKPVTLSLNVSPFPRQRVVPAGGKVEPYERQDREFPELPLLVHVDPVRRYLLAYLAPCPAPLVLYGPGDFGPASGDTMDEHAERVLALCGDDPASVLQPLINGELGAYWEREAPPKRVPREILNWRAKAVLGKMGLTDKINAMIEAIPEADRLVIAAAWNGNASLARKGATVSALAAALGLSDADVDALFIAADSIQI